MRIVVISDSHGRSRIIEKILYAQESATHVFFLGDCVSDIEDLQFIFPKMRFYIVAGNCDYFSTYPTASVEEIAGKKILFTHGHTFNVKYGTEKLLENAKKSGYDIVLYGHTHISKVLYEDGIYIVNPGSCSQGRDGKQSYAVIDIEPNGTLPNIIYL